MTASSKLFLQELDDAIQRGSSESRENALWYATDMLMVGGYSEEDVWTFGEVIGHLADVIEGATRARLSKRLVETDRAPMNIIEKLAFDHDIDVAGPILQ